MNKDSTPTHLRNFKINLLLGSALFTIFAIADSVNTINGLQGNTALEGNPIVRLSLEVFGIVPGLIIHKTSLLLFCILLAVVTHKGIANNSKWVFYLALTNFTRNWMKKKKRYWLAFMPLYLSGLAQGLAALSWLLV
jgi:hypothetical protein